MASLVCATLSNSFSSFLDGKIFKYEEDNAYKPGKKQDLSKNRFQEAIKVASSATSIGFMLRQALPYMGKAVMLEGLEQLYAELCSVWPFLHSMKPLERTSIQIGELLMFQPGVW